MEEKYEEYAKKMHIPVTPGRKIGEYTDFDGKTCFVSDPTLEDGRSAKLFVQGKEVNR